MNEKNAVDRMRLEITVTRLAGGWSGSMKGFKRHIEEWCEAALSGQKGGVCVVLADDVTSRNLNRTYRGKDRPTNVLSFEGEGEELGDIILAYETVKREAKEQKKSFARHTAHLIVHGCLHLLGHDHEQDKEADEMEALETSILKRLGFPNPYQTAA